MTAKKKPREYYRFRNGSKGALPVYYRNKLWNEDEREYLWTQKLDEQIRFVKGHKIDVSTEKGEKEYEAARLHHWRQDKFFRKNDAKMKFKWERQQYAAQRKYLKYLTVEALIRPYRRE